MPDDATPTPRYGVLAAALLGLEFLAGMQSFLISTIQPVVAAELSAHQYYGLITGVAQIAMFLTMPLGPALLHRIPVNRLLLHLTGLFVAGGVVSAVAPGVGVFLAGRAMSGLAAGTLATVSLAAIVAVLPPTWRRTVLAGYNVIWVFASLVGPLYAGWVTSALSWRWALVLYLPVLVAARAVVARQLRGQMQDAGAEPLRVGAAITLATGVGLASLMGFGSLPAPAAWGLGAAGVVVALVATCRLLPAGVFRARRGRPAAIASMGLISTAYFGASGIMSILVHDLLGGSAVAVSVVLAAGGMAWALAGLYASRRPATAPRAYRRRTTAGALAMAAGICAVIGSLAASAYPTGGGDVDCSVAVAVAGWFVAGAGMGLYYLDTLNRIVEVPAEPDGVSVTGSAAAAVLAESVATAIAATTGAALLGRAIALAGAGAGPGGAGNVVLGAVVLDRPSLAAIGILGVLVLVALVSALTPRRVDRLR